MKGEKMSKKRIELNEKTEKLVEKYLDINESDINELTNNALESFLVDHLSTSQVKEALQEVDGVSGASTAYSEHLFQNSIDDLNRF